MNRRMLLIAMLALVAPVAIAGCASTPDESDSTEATFDSSVDQVQKAAVMALTAQGFEVTRNEPLYVEGFRPRKVGMFVGSGGETAGVWLNSVSAEQTSVRVDTAKSTVGYLGQKDWTQEILSDIRRELRA